MFLKRNIVNGNLYKAKRSTLKIKNKCLNLYTIRKNFFIKEE